jgi:RNA polymerase sigma-70 factor (ECF subfamily)
MPFGVPLVGQAPEGVVMSDDSSFDELVTRLRAGDNDAAAEVFNQYAQRLIALARTQLDSQIRQKEDPEDVVLSACKSFFLRQADGQIDLEDEDSLWRMLALITVRKCRNRVEYFHAACRDVQREVSGPSDPRASLQNRQAVADDPTPSEAAILAETMEELMRGVEEEHRDIISLHLQGYTIAEISSQVGRAERTVRRILERTKKRMRRIQAEIED